MSWTASGTKESHFALFLHCSFKPPLSNYSSPALDEIWGRDPSFSGHIRVLKSSISSNIKMLWSHLIRSFYLCPHPPFPPSSGLNQACKPQMGKVRVVLCGMGAGGRGEGCSFFLDPLTSTLSRLLFVAFLWSDQWRRWIQGQRQCSLPGAVDFLSSHYWRPPTSSFLSQKMISDWRLLSPPLPTPITTSQLEALDGSRPSFRKIVLVESLFFFFEFYFIHFFIQQVLISSLFYI